MKFAAAFAASALALCGCSDLSRPHPIRVSRDETGMRSQVEIAPNNMVRIPGPDGKPIEVPRLRPSGGKDAGMPVLPGEKVERSPRPAAPTPAAH